jgi:uncharacterized Zn finger protein
MLEPLVFLVQGSSSEPYTVHILRAGARVVATCNCPAGAMGQMCKHRIRIMQGDCQNVVSENLEQVRKMPSYLEGTIIPAAFQEIARLEKELEKAKRSLAQAKDLLAKSLGV